MITDGTPIEPTVLAQAAEWFAVLWCDDVTDADRARWQAWLQAGPEHQRAWAQVERIAQRFRELPAGPARAALDAAGSGRRRALKALAVLAVGGPALWAGWRLAPVAEWRVDYRTAVGEIREIRLADGTRVWLNTATALNVRYVQTQRRLELVSGEVMIETAPDERIPPRALILETVLGTLRPLGTRFSVHDRGDTVAVSVFSGAVTVQPAVSGAEDLVVRAGRRTLFSQAGVNQPRPLPPGGESWTRGVLMANGMRLEDFLTELGRYRDVMSELARNLGQSHRFERGIEVADEIPDPYHRAEGYIRIAKNMHRTGDQDGAFRLLQRTEDLTAEIEEYRRNRTCFCGQQCIPGNLFCDGKSGRTLRHGPDQTYAAARCGFYPIRPAMDVCQ